MTLGNSILEKRCDLCGNVLAEGMTDIHELSTPYELPYKIEWEGTKCTITNKVVRHICANCLGKIMETINGCLDEAQGR